MNTVFLELLTVGNFHKQNFHVKNFLPIVSKDEKFLITNYSLIKLLKLNAIYFVSLYRAVTSPSVAISIICSVESPLLSPAISIHFNNNMRMHTSPCQDQVAKPITELIQLF